MCLFYLKENVKVSTFECIYIGYKLEQISPHMKPRAIIIHNV